MINLIEIPLIVFWGLLTAYLLMLTVAALVGQRQRCKHGRSRMTPCRFMIIIPAHNEAQLIGRTLEQLQSVDYPQDLRTIAVVADNCTDATAAIARSHGAAVYERFDQTRLGKGNALNWIQAQLANQNQFDGYIFMDADSSVSRNFLWAMKEHLESGEKVIQARYTLAEPTGSRLQQLSAIAFSLFNFVRPMGRAQLGLSVGLRGNGMCFHKSVMTRIRWNGQSLVEDLDLGNRLLMDGITVNFCPGATVTSSCPTAKASLTTQHTRWEWGRFTSLVNDVPKLLRRIVKARTYSLSEPVLDLILPPLAIFGSAAIFFLLLNSVLAYWWPKVFLSWATAWGIIVMAITFHVIAGALVAGVRPRCLLALFSLPSYINWKFGMYRRMVLRKAPPEWTRTER